MCVDKCYKLSFVPLRTYLKINIKNENVELDCTIILLPILNQPSPNLTPLFIQSICRPN